MQGKKPHGRQKRGVNRQARPPWGRCQRWACRPTKLWLKAPPCRGWRLVLSVTPLSPQPSRQGPAPAAVASATLQQRRTQQSRRRSLSLGAEHPLPASVYPGGAVVSRLLIALMSRVQVCIPVVPVAHACRPRAGEPAGPPARCVVPAGSQLLYKLQGDSRQGAFRASAFSALLRLAS